jgi:hypothetical protein
VLDVLRCLLPRYEGPGPIGKSGHAKRLIRLVHLATKIPDAVDHQLLELGLSHAVNNPPSRESDGPFRIAISFGKCVQRNSQCFRRVRCVAVPGIPDGFRVVSSGAGAPLGQGAIR